MIKIKLRRNALSIFFFRIGPSEKRAFFLISGGKIQIIIIIQDKVGKVEIRGEKNYVRIRIWTYISEYKDRM